MALSGLYPIFNHWGEDNAVWVISDTHFSDEELQAGIPNRPTDKEIIDRINCKVGKNGYLIHLGDVGNIECARQLKGYKILVCGNHDVGASKYQRKVENRIFDKAQYTKEEAMEEMRQAYPDCKINVTNGSHELNIAVDFWIGWADNCLFDEVYTGPLMIGEKLLLSHEPLNINWAINLHGHVHNGNFKRGVNHYNFCSDVINYTPISLNAFLKSGVLSSIDSIHRITIDKASKKKENI